VDAGAEAGAAGAGCAPVAAPEVVAEGWAAVAALETTAEGCVEGRAGACVERPQLEQKVVPSGCEAPQL
jgi:hypothetical protein